MCGIFGVHSLAQRHDDQAFERALSYLAHRGPDHSQVNRLDDCTIFGHTRLSIIDLSAANHQPFILDDRYALTYNGEIYNYVEIRDELRAKGIEFSTTGDTEVLLRSYVFWGESCVTRFNGMWAFAIYDSKLKKLFCSRDRFGVKPFVYYQGNGEFIFSSEIKPIIAYKPGIKSPNYTMIANYCQKSIGGQAEQTWFDNIYRLMPAHNLVVENGRVRKYRYWNYPQKVDRSITFDSASKKFREIFIDAVRIRMRSDVPVGSTLSSGLDSSAIVGVIDRTKMGRIDTFTAYSPDSAFTENDTRPFRSAVALDESVVVKDLLKHFDVNPSLIKISFDNYSHRLAEAIYYMESGHSSPAVICIHQIYKQARNKVKVLLEGQGADELSGGYIVDNFIPYLIQNIRRGQISRSIADFRLFSRYYSVTYLMLLYLRRYDSAFLNRLKNIVRSIDIFSDKATKFEYIRDNPGESPPFDDSFNHRLYKQHTSGLVNLLQYGDALSMAEGIETRLPFMDYRLVDFTFRLPYNFKVNGIHGKYIQRKALAPFVPDFISTSNVKIGFATPLDKLIRTDPEIRDILFNQPCGDLFNEHKVRKLFQAHIEGKSDHASLLYRIASAKIWYRTFFGGGPLAPPARFELNLTHSDTKKTGSK